MAMELSKNQIVKLRNGVFGAVMSFNDTPMQIVFAAFSNPTRLWKDLKRKNSQYDIVEIYDGSKLENVRDVYKKSFKADGLDLVWSEEAAK